jgi:membrane protein DedA with SNARE-associated domain
VFYNVSLEWLKCLGLGVEAERILGCYARAHTRKAKAMDLLQSQLLGFLANHPFSVVFWSSLIEAVGIPFPSRVILILTPAFLATERDLVRLIIVAAIGALLGDHVPYTAGRVAGTRMLGLYCKITLGSARCIEKTLEYFRRFGTAALLLSRFSTSVRIFASASAGSGHITYSRYLAFDTIGTVVYTSFWVLVGYLIGERAVVFFTTDRRRWLFLGFVVLAAATLIGYRLWRRFRYGGARASNFEKGYEPGVKGERG